MVGFGSSLRMGRRTGWEAAYLDYETLKLLLSQIESVYEEELHHSHQTRDVFMGEPDASEGNRHERTDYRDELFLESDSDAAFASSQSNVEDSSSDNSLDDKPRPSIGGKHGNGQGFSGFSLMSFETGSSSEESYSAEDTGNFGVVPWGTGNSSSLRNGKRRTKSKKRYKDEEDYYVPNSGPETFIMDQGSESFDPNSKAQYTSLFNAPFQGLTSEYTSLLPQSNSAKNRPLFPNRSLTPPKEQFGSFTGQEVSSFMNAKPAMYGSNQNPTPTEMTSKTAKRDKERHRARRQRRRRKLARLRKARERKVPRHIRRAHSKARAITERFLGLLRAEVEKVTLFAQARLGELADTAGSLRFLSSEELTELSENFVARKNSAAYDHPLSDGGIHPSASSSSDDGGGQGLFPWSDSSEDDETSKASSRLNLPHNFSGGGLSKHSERRVDLAKRGNFSRGRNPKKQPMDQQQELYHATRRKINHFEEVRRERPIFQRNDHIVGEDMLLLSAVDEADAFIPVGVELMHILKYICVNVIAVRKICRKHDRLLMNRMLGGYYHRKRTTRAQDERTLGGMIAHVSGDIHEVHPSVIGLVNHGKLLGIYDLKIQQLANSRTVKVISSCLALALSEYEVSRIRADALARLNSSNARQAAGGVLAKKTEAKMQKAVEWVRRTKDNFASPCNDIDLVSLCSDDEKGSGPPSTASSISLTRLRFTVLSIAALREASRFKSDCFATYLSRSTLSFTGLAVIGEGLDGCSRETLDFLVCYNPDAALLLDSSALHEGLRRGRWRHMSIGSVMRSSLAVALAPIVSANKTTHSTIHDEELIVMNSLGILPESEGIDSSVPDGTPLPLSTSLSISRFMDFSPVLLRANRFSQFLYTANYYIVHPTANAFVKASGANLAYSAAIIGAASFSAIFSAALQCLVLSGYSRENKPLNFNFAPFRRLLIFSALTAVLGNIVHAHAISESSVPLAILGRLLLGLASADIVHRQFVVEFIPPSLIVAESARLCQFQVMGLATGLLLGSLNELVPFQSVGQLESSIQISNWLMVVLWTIQFSRLLCGDRKHASSKNKVYQTLDSDEVICFANSEDSSDSSSESDAASGPAHLFHNPTETRVGDEMEQRQNEKKLVSDVPPRPFHRSEISSLRRRGLRKVGVFMKRIRRILSYNVALPITLALVVYTTYAQEMFFTSCALITDLYFGWRGSFAGLFLGGLSVLILPIDFLCEKVARRYEERTTIKVRAIKELCNILEVS